MEFIKSNMTAGVLTPELHARIDIDKYINGVAEAKNMIIMPYGGLRRRPGTEVIAHLDSEARLEAFVFNSTQKYVIVIKPSQILIYKDGVLMSTESSPYTTMTQINDLDVIQSADTMIFAHQSFTPYQLQRQGSDTNWTLSAIVFTSEPYKTFGTAIIYKYVNDGLLQTVDLAINDIVLNQSNHTYYKSLVARNDIELSVEVYTNATNWSVAGVQEKAWSATKGYPRCVTFHGGRLWFAGATESPTTIWGSKVNGFFDFSMGQGAADDALEDILDTDQYNIIQNIFSGRDLQVYTTGSEFYNSANPITPETSSWKRQTGYGSIKIRPILIDGATMYIDSSGRTVRQFLYDFTEDSYVSANVSLLSSHIITRAVSIACIKGTQYDVGDYVYVVNEDGTVAILNTMRLEKITGWTNWETAGNFENVCVVDKDVYFTVLRNGERFLERLEENSYTDHHKIIKGTYPDVGDVVHLLDEVVFGSDTVLHTDPDTGTPVTSITTNFHSSMMNTTFKVIADLSIQKDAKPTGVGGANSFTIDREAYRLEVGLNYLTKVLTLPLSTETRQGNTLHRRKRVVKVDISVINSLGVFANKRYSSDRKFTVVLDRTQTPYTGFKEMYLLGYDRLAEIEISQEEPLPFTLRALSYEVEY